MTARTRSRSRDRRVTRGLVLAGIWIVIGLVLGAWPSKTLALGVLAVPDTLSTPHDRLATVAAPGVLANDVTLLGTTAVLVSTTTHGTLNLASNGGYTYQPAASFVGTDVFTYMDSGQLLGSATVTITVTNSAPVAVNDSYTAVTGVTLTVPAPGVLGNDSDADGDAMTASKVTDSGSGSVNLNSNGAFSFKSGGSFTGLRTFTYRVTDGLAWSSTVIVSIQVNAPAPTPTPVPTPAPSPTPLPTAPPLPTITPLPSVLPLPTVTPLPTLPPMPSVPVPSLVPSPIASIVPSSPASSTPTTSTEPSPSSDGGSGGIGTGPTASPGFGGPGSGGSGAGAGSTGPGDSDGGALVVGNGDEGPFGLGDVGGFGTFDGLDWVVPALAMTVPGILLILAVMAQLMTSAVWLPLVRRRLSGTGVARRRREAGETLGRANS